MACTQVPSVATHLGEDFLAQVYGHTHRVIRGEPDRFAGLLSWDDLNDILAYHRLEPPRLRLAAGGTTLPPHDYTTPVVTRRHVVWRRLRPAALHTHLGSGATLVLDAIDELHPRVNAVARELESHFRTSVQVNAYASWTATEGFGVHWDDHDVLAIQLDGAKQWRIYEPTRHAPMYRDIATPEPPLDEQAVELVLSAGDMLYLPRGWWHTATASAGSSLHLSCGLQTVTGADLITWLSEMLRHQDAIRSDIPVLGTREEKHRYLDTLRELLSSELDDENLIERYLTTRDATERARLRPSFPYINGVTPRPSLRAWLVTSRARLTHDSDGHAVLTAGGEEWTFTAQAAPALRLLTEGGAHTLDDLAKAADLTVDDAAAVVTQLVSGEVAAVGDAW